LPIVRSALSFEGKFTQIPNTWIRDKRLTLKAKGLLAQLLSHSDGWQVSVYGLSIANNCGRDSIRTAVKELEECGYLVRSQKRADGAFAEAFWETADPWSENPPAENATSVNSTHKNTSSSENTNIKDLFDQFWNVYPRKFAKGSARKAFEGALGAADFDEIIAGVVRLANDPNLPEERFIPYPATWLGREGWHDAPYPAKELKQWEKPAELPGHRDWVAGLHRAGEHYDCRGGEFNHPLDWKYEPDMEA